MEEQDKLGTPDQDGGEQAENTPDAGTPDEDGRGGLSQEDIAKLNLAWKAKAEEANELKRRLAELEARVGQSPAAQEPEDDGEDDGDESAAYWHEVDKLASKGNTWAKVQLRERRERERDRQEREELIRGIVLRDQLNAIEDKEERVAVRDRFLKNPGRYRDIRDAQRDHEREKLAKENEELRKALSDRKPAKDVVRTHTAEVTASTHKQRKMTQAEWSKRQAQLEAAGDHKTRMSEQMARRSGKILVED